MHVRSMLLSSVLVLLALGVCSQPSAFPQEASQQTVTRKLKGKVDAKYPELARQYQLSGKVKVEVVISPDGSVKKAHVIGGSPLLAGAAVEAVKQWKYEPGSKETIETVDFDFEHSMK